MSLAALPERSASFRTSSATTAKRRPDSPAPAASMAALSARRLVCEAMSSMVFTISEISSDRSARLLIFLEMPCTSPRIRCIPVRLARTACSPFVAESRVSLAAAAEASAFSATRRIERLSPSIASLTPTASLDWAWAPPAVASMAPIISVALVRT